MKKQLLNLSAVCVALAISGNVLAQEVKNADVLYTESALTIDGVIEDAWESFAPQAIDRIFTAENPTIEAATFQAAWNEDGIFVVVSVTDNEWFPLWVSGNAGWESDHVELYFDVSDPLVDGGGPANADQRAAGNYQVAPDFTNDQSVVTTTAGDTPGVQVSNTFDEVGSYIKEYFVPFSAIPQAGTAIDPTVMTTIGFDVSLSDRNAMTADGGRRDRLVWCNDASVTSESWNILDAVGRLNFTVGVKEQAANTNILRSNVVKNEIVFNTQVSDVKVLNTMGQVVRTGANVSDLANGVYIVTANTAKGVVANRFVKQ